LHANFLFGGLNFLNWIFNCPYDQFRGHLGLHWWCGRVWLSFVIDLVVVSGFVLEDVMNVCLRDWYDIVFVIVFLLWKEFLVCLGFGN
jgi:hypothetical protein